MKLYLLSGLGADGSVFYNMNFGEIETQIIQWEKPESNEPIEAYAKRLILQIDREEPVHLLGVSFGGIMAQEIARQIPCESIVLISSVKSRSEIHFTLKLAQYTQVHRLVNGGLLKRMGKWFGPFFFSISSHQDRKALLKIMDNTDEVFLSWAIDKIMNWKREPLDRDIFHIHGNDDRLFPIHKIKNCTTIKNGGHFMIYNRAAEIQELVKGYFERRF